jgi:hypothetical protein
MTTNQSIVTAEYPHFEAAVNYLNSMFGGSISIEKKDQQHGMTLVTINATHSQAAFALAIEYGRRLEQSKFREYIKIMQEEMQD